MRIEGSVFPVLGLIMCVISAGAFYWKLSEIGIILACGVIAALFFAQWVLVMRSFGAWIDKDVSCGHYGGGYDGDGVMRTVLIVMMSILGVEYSVVVIGVIGYILFSQLCS